MEVVDFSKESDTYCSICAEPIYAYIPEYFCGEKVNASCDRCKRDANLLLDDHSPDPFVSFPADGMPISLVSHWASPYNIHETSLLSIPSLRAHYVMLPNPGSKFISMEEVMVEFQQMMDEHRRQMQDSCKLN